MPTTSLVARGALGIRKEASFASGGGIDNWQIIESCSISKSDVYVYGDRIRNTPEQVGGQYSHSLVAGDITFAVSPNTPTQWWNCGIGGTGPYTPQIPLSSIAIEIQEGELATVYSSGDMISRVELSSSQGDILKCTVGIEGKDLSARPSSTPSFVSGENPYMHSEGAFTLDGVAYTNITQFSVTKNNNLVTDLIANTNSRRAILATKAQVTGSIGILFEDTTMRNRFFNHLPSRITTAYARGANSFTIALNRINYNSRNAPLTGQTGYILETLDFTAYVQDPTAENSMIVTIV